MPLDAEVEAEVETGLDKQSKLRKLKIMKSNENTGRHTMNGAKALFTKYYKWPVLAVTSLLLVFSMLLVAGSVTAAGVITITPATGGTGISIDTTSSLGGTGTWTTLGTISGPVITEGSVGLVTTGIHTLSLPTGWEFNIAQNVTIGLNGPTDLTLGASVVTPGATTIQFNVTAVSTATPAVLTFSNIQVRPTGTAVSSASGTSDFGNWGTFSTGPGVAHHFTVTTGTQTAGVTFSVTVTALDQFNNVVGGQNTGANNYTGAHTINWSSTATNSPAPPNTPPTIVGNGPQTFTTGIATVGGFTLTNAGETPTIHATDTVISGTSSAITVLPGAAATLTFTTAPLSTGTVDSPLSTQPVVHVVDVDGNLVANGTSVSATVGSGTGALTGTTSATTTSGNAAFSTLGYSHVDPFTITFTSNSNTVTSGGLLMLPGAATTLTLQSGTPASIGTVDSPLSTQPIVHVVDQYSNNVPGVTVTASLNSGTGIFTPASTLTEVSDGGGNATFTNIGYEKSADNFTIKFADGGLNVTSGTLIMNAGLVTAVTIATAPASTGTVDNPLTTQPTINVVDQYGNNVAAGTTVTASNASGSGSLLGTLTANTVGTTGNATFSNLGYTKLDAFTITFTSNGHTATSGALTMQPGAAFILTITGQPSGVNSVDVALTGQPVIHVQDQYSNDVANGTVVTAVTGAPGTGVTAGNTTASTAGGAGVATFSGLKYSKIGETFTLLFTSNGHSSVNSNLVGPLTPGAVAHVTISTPPASTGTVDAALTGQPIVNVQDQFFNNVPGASVVASVGTGSGSLLGTATETSDASGNATFTNLGYTKTDNFTLTFTSNGHTVTSGTLSMTAGAVAHVTISTAPSSSGTVDAALTGQPVVNVQDQYLNNVPSASVAASITGGGTGTFTTGDTTTETSDANGNATFTNLGYTKVDSFTLSFTSNGHTAVSGA